MAELSAEEIQGHWRLTDWVQQYDDGRAVRAFGEKPNGVISYFGGRMCALISAEHHPEFTTGGQWNADINEKARAYEEMLAYGGTYEYDGSIMQHHVDISLFPNWVGITQRRQVEWDGEKLRLTARLEEGTSEARTAILEWVRA